MSTSSLSHLEALLRRDRWWIFAGLAAVVILCWLWLIPMSLDMYGSMTGKSAWMMNDQWDAKYLVLLFLMWSAMMIGMMLPTAAPTLLLYGAVVRRDANELSPVLRVYAFASGYLL